MGREWRLVGYQVVEGGKPGGPSRMRGGGRAGGRSLLSFAVQRGQTSFPGARKQLQVNIKVLFVCLFLEHFAIKHLLFLNISSMLLST